MYYCEFDDILRSIAALDADVISMERRGRGWKFWKRSEFMAIPMRSARGV
jgi:hypothetical protein